MSDESTEKPSLHIDSDWKAEAQAEKQRLAEKTGESEEKGQRELPPASFQTLLSSMVTQALLYMGAIPDPMSGQRILHLDLARHHIDLLAVLQEKTKGNLEDEEAKMLEQTLHELRLNYLQLSKEVAKQMQNQNAEALADGKSENKSGGNAADIVTP